MRYSTFALQLFASLKCVQSSSIIFSGGTVIAFDHATQGLEVLRNHSVLVVDDRIQSITPACSNISLPHDTETVDITGSILSPGFIDTHRHGWQTAFKTIGSNTSLVEYFSRYGEYVSGLNYTAEDVYIGQLAGLQESLNAGVTTVLDHAHGTWSNETSDAGLKGSIDSGARVFHAQAIHELPAQDFPISEQIAKLLDLAAEIKANPGIVSLGLAYDGWATNPEEEIRSVIAAAQEANVSVVTTHCLGGPWGYNNSPEILNSYDFLNISIPVVFAHGAFLSDNDISLLRSTNQYLSTTPESEFHYGHGNKKSHLIQDQAALGIDTHFTFSTDIVGQARIWLQAVRNILYVEVLEHQNVSGTNPMSVHQAFLLATRHGALALRRDDLGIIAEGAKADLVVFRGDSPGLLGWVDPVAAVILHSNVGDVEHVLVDGKFVKKDGKLTIEDYPGIQQRFLRSARRIQEIWKNIPIPVFTGGNWSTSTQIEDPTQEDVLRGDGTGYGEVFV